MKIKLLALVIIFAIVILCSSCFARAQTTNNSVLILQLEAKIQSLAQQINLLLAQESSTAGIIPVYSITITSADSATSVAYPDSLQMIATVLPTNATNPKVTWSLSTDADKILASIDPETGLLTPKLTAGAYGTVTVQAYSQDGTNIGASEQITITAPSSSANALTVSGANGATNITVNKTLQMIAKNASGVQVSATWSLENNMFATIDSSTGILTGTSPGTATVIAQATDGSYGITQIIISSCTGNICTMGLSYAQCVNYCTSLGEYTNSSGSGGACTCNPGKYQCEVSASANNVYSCAQSSRGGVCTPANDGTGNAYCTTPLPSSASTISITAPTSTSTLVAGSITEIIWKSTNESGSSTVNISLINTSTNATIPIATNVLALDPSDPVSSQVGGYTWTIPVSQPAGTYQITVTDASNTAATSLSPKFQILSGSQFTYPAGGENLAIGNKYNITWNTSVNAASADCTQYLSLQLNKAGGSPAVYNINLWIPVSFGSVSWTVPQSATNNLTGSLDNLSGSYTLVISNGCLNSAPVISQPFNIVAALPACVPTCSTCGSSDGCGGICQTGTCSANQKCTNGQCVTVSSPIPTLTSIKVNTTNLTLDANDAQPLTVTPLDQNGAAMSGANISYVSANPRVAGVSSSGMVTGITEGSTTITITASLGSVSLNSTVNVTVGASRFLIPSSLTIINNQSAYTAQANQTINFSAKAIASDGSSATPAEGFSVGCQIINSQINSQMLCNGTYNQSTGNWDFTITTPKNNLIGFSSSNMVNVDLICDPSLSNGQNGKCMPNENIANASFNFTLNCDPVAVCGQPPAGCTYVASTTCNCKTSCTGIAVVATQLSIPSLTSVYVGSTLQMSANILPANATNPAVTWSVIDGTGSATISSTGLLTPLTAGTVTVVAKTQDGSALTARGQINIYPAGTPISIVAPTTSLNNSQNDLASISDAIKIIAQEIQKMLNK